KRGDKVIEDRKFNIGKDDKEIEVQGGAVAKADAKDKKDLPPEEPKAGAWIQLFNGKNLDGWSTWPQGTVGWEVKDGVLSSTGALTHLYSDRGDYKNFHFRVETMVNDKGVGGQFFRARFEKGPTLGAGAMLKSTGSGAKTGSLFYDNGGFWSNQ